MTWLPSTARPTSSSCSSPAGSAQALDRFAGPALTALLGDYQRAYQRHQQVRGELDELTSLARERVREADDLRRGLAEIERAEPVEGEDIELLAEEERLSNADALHSAATTAHEALLGDPSSGSLRGGRRGHPARHRPPGTGGSGAARRRPGRAGRPGIRGRLPGIRRGRRAGLLRAVHRGRPGQARRRAGTPGRAGAAWPAPTAPGSGPAAGSPDPAGRPPAVQPHRAAIWLRCCPGPSWPAPGWASSTATMTGSPT